MMENAVRRALERFENLDTSTLPFRLSNASFCGQCLVKDCCDGSDELSGKCENTCTAAAKLHMVSVEKEIQTQESGLRVRAQYVADAARDIESKKKELVQQEAKLVQLELKAAELEQIKKTEEDKYNAAREVVEKAVREREQKLYVMLNIFSQYIGLTRLPLKVEIGPESRAPRRTLRPTLSRPLLAPITDFYMLDQSTAIDL